MMLSLAAIGPNPIGPGPGGLGTMGFSLLAMYWAKMASPN
jgi:hypothetical protein